MCHHILSGESTDLRWSEEIGLKFSFFVYEAGDFPLGESSEAAHSDEWLGWSKRSQKRSDRILSSQVILNVRVLLLPGWRQSWLESRRLVQERDAMAKLIARKRRLKAGKNAARTEKWKAARKAVASKKPKAAAETLPTAEQVEEIENKLRTGVIVEMEPVNWPKTKKEIQESLKDYKERVKWARMRGANDKVEPEVFLHTIHKLEEMLKHTK